MPAHRVNPLLTNESQGYEDTACSQNIRIPSWTHFLADMDGCRWKCKVVTILGLFWEFLATDQSLMSFSISQIISGRVYPTLHHTIA